MAPRAPTILSLMSSTAYPPLPTVDELEHLKVSLEAQSASAGLRAAAARPIEVPASMVTPDDERRKKDHKKRKDREPTDERERAALAANQRAGAALEAVERRRVETPGDVRVKHERVSPAPSNASSASFKPHSQQQQQTYGNIMKKKKKRVLDSDDEGTSHHHPPPQHTASTSGLKLKLAPGGHNKTRPTTDPSPTPSASLSNTGPGSSIDWGLPPPLSRPLIPIRPGVQKPLKPGPKRQADVNEDFSDKKAPSQIAMGTFWQNIEPYIRDVREDDLAMLNFKADTPDSYVIPPKGRHYTDIWDEEDGNLPGTTPRIPAPGSRQPPNAPLAHCIATEIRDPNLVEENRGLGPMTERVVAALIGGPDVAESNKELAVRPEPDLPPREPARVDVVDLEDRVKKELRTVMLLGEHEELDQSNREDDEVTSALRQCQRQLMQQTAINDARKERLAKIARGRLAYGEYHSVLEDLDKSIEAMWAKRVKKHGSGGKQILKDGVIVGPGRPPVPELLKQKLDTRQRWESTVGKAMRELPPGEVLGLPTKSIYEGIGEENEEKDEKAVDDAMDVDEVDADEVDLSTV